MTDNHDILLWPLSPAPTFDEVYDPAICPEEQREYSTVLESWVDPSQVHMKPECLQRIRVLEATGDSYQVNGHWCGGQLGELGAEVIMVEPPGGSKLRQLTPFGREKYMIEDSVNGEACGLSFLHECRNKKSITLNLSTEKGQEIFKKLAIHSDVVIDNYPPGQMDEWGIGYRQLSKINPRLVYGWVGQRGQWGPAKDPAGAVYPMGDCTNAFIGSTGQPRSFGGTPTRAGERASDHIGGSALSFSIVTALIYRDTVSGKGQFVEATGGEGHLRIHDYAWGWWGYDGSIKPRYGNWDLAINIYSVNPCKDGYMMIGGGHDRLWYRIWKVVGKDRPELEDLILDEPTLRMVIDRVGHDQQVKTLVCLSDWLKDWTRAESREKLLAEEVASGGVMFMDEIAEEPHYKYRAHVIEVDTSYYGKQLVCNSIFMAGHRSPGRVKDIGRPRGFDNDDIYRRLLGLQTSQLNELAESGVI
jgi:crotonobetainyl-CoA:carnitine CoA-transferase CaiB-like acyl-CoA transferase